MLSKSLLSSLIALGVVVFFSLSFPQTAQAACTCQPIGNDYKQGRWVNETGGLCSKNYGVCILNCVISELDTATCIKRCTNTDLSCNPLTETTIDVGFQVPTFSVLLGNIIKLVFFVAGLLAIFQLLMGGFEWVISGGEEKKIEAARAKIVAAVVGLVVMIASLSLAIFLEQVVFGGKICLGISCPMNLNFLKLIR